MCREIIETKVCFRFDDRSASFVVQEKTANQRLRQFDCRPFEEGHVYGFRLMEELSERGGVN